MIVAWVVYGISVIIGLSAVGAAAGGKVVPTSWIAAIWIAFLLGWGLMLAYTELSRRGGKFQVKWNCKDDDTDNDDDDDEYDDENPKDGANNGPML